MKDRLKKDRTGEKETSWEAMDGEVGEDEHSAWKRNRKKGRDPPFQGLIRIKYPGFQSTVCVGGACVCVWGQWRALWSVGGQWGTCVV